MSLVQSELNKECLPVEGLDMRSKAEECNIMFEHVISLTPKGVAFTFDRRPHYK
jgi:hypothetical protein